jgi:hypothetical protein
MLDALSAEQWLWSPLMGSARVSPRSIPARDATCAPKFDVEWR